MARTNYYEGLAADYSRPGLVSEELKAKLIQRSAEIGVLQESTLPAIGPDYTLEQIEAENREFWPTHCEALRQGRGDLLTKEYRPDLVYHAKTVLIMGLRNSRSVRSTGGQLLLNQM